MSSKPNDDTERTIDLKALETDAAAVDAQNQPPPVAPEPEPAAVEATEKWQPLIQGALDQGCQMFAPNWWANDFGKITPSLAKEWAAVVTATPFLQSILERVVTMGGPWSRALIMTWVAVQPFAKMPRIKNAEPQKTENSPPSAPVQVAAH